MKRSRVLGDRPIHLVLVDDDRGGRRSGLSLGLVRKSGWDRHDDRLLTRRLWPGGLAGAEGGGEGTGTDVGQTVREVGELASGGGVGSGPTKLNEQGLPKHASKHLYSLNGARPLPGAKE